MLTCFVLFCKNHFPNHNKGVRFHRIPNKSHNEWMAAIGRPTSLFQHNSNRRICSEHFKASDYIYDNGKKTLKNNAIPSLKLRKRGFVEKRDNPELDATPSHQRPDEIQILNPEPVSMIDLPSTSQQIDPLVDEKRRSVLKRKFPFSSSSDSEGLKGSPKRRRRSLRTFHNYCLSPRKLKHEVESKVAVIKNLRKRLKVSTQKVKRQSKKINHLKDVLTVLSKKKVLSDNSITILNKTIDTIPYSLMRRLVGNLKRKKITRQKFPEELRSFAMTLSFYSTRAYNYVRKTFQLALPSLSVIRSWLANIDCSPGFAQSALNTLKMKVKQDQAKGIQTTGCIMIDEMALKKQVELVGSKIWGYVDLGTEVNSDQIGIAKDALVLMFVSLNSHWKIPIAYFLINGLNGAEKANIIKQALVILAEIGVTVVSNTCDGPSAHFTMARELGAKLNVGSESDIQPYFLHPTTNLKVFIIFDACHMEKLVRNMWAQLIQIYDKDGNEINFNFIIKLHELQESIGLRFGNKLRRAHIEWTKQKMKVHLATQTLSASVADALEFLSQEGVEEFRDAQATIKFIRIMNNLFDICNSRNAYARGYKAPLKKSNELHWRTLIIEGINYLKTLKNKDGKLLYMTPNSTPIKGFITTLTSLMGIYDTYIKPEFSLSYLLTYKMSQDHLELFFYVVRTRNGTNNNPTPFQFNSTFKRLMLYHDVKEGAGNCISQDETTILTITNKPKPSSEISIDDLGIMKKYGLSEDELYNDHDYELVVPFLDNLTENIVTYIAGFIVKQLKKVVKCLTCVTALEDTCSETKDDFTFKLLNKKNRGGLIKPSDDVVTIIKFVEIHIKKLLDKTDNKLPAETNFLEKFVLNCYILFTRHENEVFKSLTDHIFDYSTFAENHVSKLVKLTIYKYTKLRFFSIGKKQTEEERGSLVRKQLSKLILFKNQ